MLTPSHFHWGRDKSLPEIVIYRLFARSNVSCFKYIHQSFYTRHTILLTMHFFIRAFLIRSENVILSRPHPSTPIRLWLFVFHSSQELWSLVSHRYFPKVSISLFRHSTFIFPLHALHVCLYFNHYILFRTKSFPDCNISSHFSCFYSFMLLNNNK